MWYLVMTLIEDNDDVQINGIVGVRYCVGMRLFSSFQFIPYFRYSRVLIVAFPATVKGYHVCYDDFGTRVTVAAIQDFLSTPIRVRFRAHYGKFDVQVECTKVGMQHDRFHCL